MGKGRGSGRQYYGSYGYDLAAIVKSGSLRMVMKMKGHDKTGLLAPEGNEKVIMLAPGDIFSETLADSQHFETIVTVVEEAELVTFNGEQFARLSRQFPQENAVIAKHFGI